MTSGARSGLGWALRLSAAAAAGAAFALALFVGLYIAAFPPAPGLSYREALLYDAPGPRLIVEAGSGSLYGLDVAALGRSLNRVGIIVADNGGFNLQHKAWRLLAHARPGDAVVMPLEWTFYEQPDALTDTYVMLGVPLYPSYFRSIPLREKLRILAATPLSSAVPALWANLGARLPGRDRPRRQLALDRFAELVALGSEGRQEPQWIPERSLRPEAARQSCAEYLFSLRVPNRPPPDREGLRRVLSILAQARARGVSVVFVPPVVAGDDCYARAAGLAPRLAEIRAILAERGFDYLGAPTDFWLPQSRALDTYYHVDAEARALATARLLPLLQAAGLRAPGPPGGRISEVLAGYARRNGLPPPALPPEVGAATTD
ncbi:hypothetical protein [Muricoccus radiodurans]|uniref:hypothetical protein n=1 Tax=Muricoccus radiodurans TaxID=2231721 RepID=UPI003CEE1546